MMDHTAILQLVGGVLSLLSAFVLGIWGAPKARMAHARAIEKIRGTATDRLVASWELRAAKLEERLDQQEAKCGHLQGENAELQDCVESLKGRVAHLENQILAAGVVHTADLATISNLREELDSHVLELAQTREALAERDERIAALEARVAELEEALHRDSDTAGDVGAATMERLRAKAKPTKKKGKR